MKADVAAQSWRASIIDPGFVRSITGESHSTTANRMLVLNLGSEELVPGGVQVKGAAAKVGIAGHMFNMGPTHFNFLADCANAGEVPRQLRRTEPAVPRCQRLFKGRHSRRTNGDHIEKSAMKETVVRIRYSNVNFFSRDCARPLVIEASRCTKFAQRAPF